MKRVYVLCVVGLVLAGCGGDAEQAEAQKKLEATQGELHEAESRAQSLTADVEQLKARLREAESARATRRHELEDLQKRLAESWRGDASTLKSHMEAAEVPAALRGSLQEAQKAMGGAAPEQRFRQGVERKDLALVSSVLTEWASREGVTPAPEAPAEETTGEEGQTCERVTGDFTCAPLALGGSGDGVTQLCRLADRSWVVRSDHGALAYAQLMPGFHARYKPVRMMGSDVWLLRDDTNKSSDLEVFEVSGTQAVRRHALKMVRKGKPAAVVETDLDSDGVKETLVVGADEVEAVHREGPSGSVSVWQETDVCPKVQGRSEKELEGVRAACVGWNSVKAPRQ